METTNTGISYVLTFKKWKIEKINEKEKWLRGIFEKKIIKRIENSYLKGKNNS